MKNQIIKLIDYRLNLIDKNRIKDSLYNSTSESIFMIVSDSNNRLRMKIKHIVTDHCDKLLELV